MLRWVSGMVFSRSSGSAHRCCNCVGHLADCKLCYTLRQEKALHPSQSQLREEPHHHRPHGICVNRRTIIALSGTSRSLRALSGTSRTLRGWCGRHTFSNGVKRHAKYFMIVRGCPGPKHLHFHAVVTHLIPKARLHWLAEQQPQGERWLFLRLLARLWWTSAVLLELWRGCTTTGTMVATAQHLSSSSHPNCTVTSDTGTVA